MKDDTKCQPLGIIRKVMRTVLVSILCFALIAVFSVESAEAATNKLTLTLTKSSITIDYGSKFNAKNYIKSAKDQNGKDIKSKVKISSSVNTKKAKTYTVTYTVTSNNETVKKTLKVKVRTSSETKRLKIVNTAKSKLGCLYKYGAAGPTRFDCSGLVYYCYKQAGKSVAHSSSALKSKGKVISISKAQVGDIVWRPGHVGIYVGNGKVIHSPHSGAKVSYTKASTFKYAVRYI